MDIDGSPAAINLKSLSRNEQKQVLAKRKRYDRPVYYRNGDFCTVLAHVVGSPEYGKLETDLLNNGWSMVIG